jgi:hypothetical protein
MNPGENNWTLPDRDYTECPLRRLRMLMYFREHSDAVEYKEWRAARARRKETEEDCSEANYRSSEHDCPDEQEELSVISYQVLDASSPPPSQTDEGDIRCVLSVPPSRFCLPEKKE